MPTALLNIRNTPSQSMESSTVLPSDVSDEEQRRSYLARSVLDSRSSVTKQETDQLKIIQRRYVRTMIGLPVISIIARWRHSEDETVQARR